MRIRSSQKKNKNFKILPCCPRCSNVLTSCMNSARSPRSWSASWTFNNVPLAHCRLLCIVCSLVKQRFRKCEGLFADAPVLAIHLQYSNCNNTYLAKTLCTTSPPTLSSINTRRLQSSMICLQRETNLRRAMLFLVPIQKNQSDVSLLKNVSRDSPFLKK